MKLRPPTSNLRFSQYDRGDTGGFEGPRRRVFAIDPLVRPPPARAGRLVRAPNSVFLRRRAATTCSVRRGMGVAPRQAPSPPGCSTPRRAMPSCAEATIGDPCRAVLRRSTLTTRSRGCSGRRCRSCTRVASPRCPPTRATPLVCHLDDKAAAEALRAASAGVDEASPDAAVLRPVRTASYARVDNRQYRLLGWARLGRSPSSSKRPKEGAAPRVASVVAHDRPARARPPRDRQALLEQLGQPLLATTLIAPGETEPMNDPEAIRERLQKAGAGGSRRQRLPAPADDDHRPQRRRRTRRCCARGRRPGRAGPGGRSGALQRVGDTLGRSQPGAGRGRRTAACPAPSARQSGWHRPCRVRCCIR